MQSSSGQSFELLEAVEDVNMFMFVVRCHVTQLDEVAVADAEREDLDLGVLTQTTCHWARVSAV